MKSGFLGRIAVLTIVGLACIRASGQVPVGTAFTYQGQLKRTGAPVSNLCDFQFRLFDLDIGAAQIGPIVMLNNVDVVEGLFTVALDFGPGVFDGEARWLEIDVRCPAGSGSFTTLSPRQELTPAPYSIFSTNPPSGGGIPAGFAILGTNPTAPAGFTATGDSFSTSR